MCEDLNTDSAPLVPAPENPAPVEDWKAGLRRDFESWLASLDEPIGDTDDEYGEDELPDLRSFYEQLAVTNTEGRKANRRIAEALNQWGETLARFESLLAELRQAFANASASVSPDRRMPDDRCLMLVELLDRMHRLEKAFATPPARARWWHGDKPWRRAWETQRQGFRILLDHFEAMLEKEGVTRLQVVGSAFDPATMLAIATGNVPTAAPQMVIEELAPGYRRGQTLLRPAQVKVNVGRPSAGPNRADAVEVR